MDTPKTGRELRSDRNYTPRLSQRKKDLFPTERSNDRRSNDDDDPLDGITILSETPDERSTNTSSDSETPSSRTRARLGLRSNSKLIHDRSEANNSSTSSSNSSPDSAKENKPRRIRSARKRSEELPKLFSNSMNLSDGNMPSDDDAADMTIQSSQAAPQPDGDNEHIFIPETPDVGSRKRQRRLLTSPQTAAAPGMATDKSSPQRKVAKLDGFTIPTTRFYSSQPESPTAMFMMHIAPANMTSTQKKRRSPTGRVGINKGVGHKIRRPVRRSILGECRMASMNVDDLLGNIRNEKLQKMIRTKREHREQAEKVHEILRRAKNPIAMARPLRALENGAVDGDNNNNNKSFSSTTDFSDIECDDDDNDVDDGDGAVDGNRSDGNNFAFNNFGSDDDDDDNWSVRSYQPRSGNDLLPTLAERSTTPTATTTRKFFKSGRATNTRKEVQITENIKLKVGDFGKLSLKHAKTPCRWRHKVKDPDRSFSMEQATVAAILKNLDDTAYGDVMDEGSAFPSTSNDHPRQEPDDTACGDVMDEGSAIPSTSNDHHQQEPMEKTQEPDREQQEPDGEQQDLDQDLATANREKSPQVINDAAEATAASTDAPLDTSPQSNRVSPTVDSGNCSDDYIEFRSRLPYNTEDPELIENQHILLDFLIFNNICTEDNFRIFITHPDEHREEAQRIIDRIVVIVDDNSKYFDRLPYKTDNPDVIARQHRHLNFLIKHDICTEENFDIFIANYATRHAEAASIVAAVHAKNERRKEQAQQKTESSRQQSNGSPPMPNMSPGQALSTTAVPDQTPSPPIQSLAPGPAPTGKLFPVFYPGRCQPLTIPTSSRHRRRGISGRGAGQYQIDAGQRQFGAHQCPQCGLVYSVHEPEEEALHRDFHASMYVLRFKGWIDEDIVAVCPEWGSDGRILRITERSHPKRLERLTDILRVVDKELGFSAYVMPPTFVAYLAARKQQIVGLCLVQPLTKAHRYVCSNGVDCCTEEEFEAKCGVSRIWIAPLHRRLRIATKLIHAVQQNTILGERIALDQIAFSAPTEMGRAFAQRVTQTVNFLVYQ